MHQTCFSRNGMFDSLFIILFSPLFKTGSFNFTRLNFGTLSEYSITESSMRRSEMEFLRMVSTRPAKLKPAFIFVEYSVIIRARQIPEAIKPARCENLAVII